MYTKDDYRPKALIFGGTNPVVVVQKSRPGAPAQDAPTLEDIVRRIAQAQARIAALAASLKRR